MSKIKVDTIEGSTGTTITVPSGQTLTVTDGIAATNLSGTIADARLPTVPVAKGGTGLTSLGSAGQAIKVNSGGNGLEFGTISSDFVKLQGGGSNSAVSSVVFDNLDVSTYASFKLIWNSVPSGDNEHLRMTIRTGGSSGATHTTSHYHSAQIMVTGSSGSIATAHESGTAYWEIGGNAGNQTTEGHDFEIFLYPRKSTHESGHGNFFTASGSRIDSSGNYRYIGSSGTLRTSSQPTTTGYSIFYTGGNIAQYDYELYGIK